MEGQIASLRAELLHKEQENERVQLQLVKEREDREKAQRQVCFSSTPCLWRTSFQYTLDGAPKLTFSWSCHINLLASFVSLSCQVSQVYLKEPCSSKEHELIFAASRKGNGLDKGHDCSLYVQVDGLTRLMLGAVSEDKEKVRHRKENRRETWAPGLGEPCFDILSYYGNVPSQICSLKIKLLEYTPVIERSLLAMSVWRAAECRRRIHRVAEVAYILLLLTSCTIPRSWKSEKAFGITAGECDGRGQGGSQIRSPAANHRKWHHCFTCTPETSQFSAGRQWRGGRWCRTWWEGALYAPWTSIHASKLEKNPWKEVK